MFYDVLHSTIFPLTCGRNMLVGILEMKYVISIEVLFVGYLCTVELKLWAR